jgi:hypothetical protein
MIQNLGTRYLLSLILLKPKKNPAYVMAQIRLPAQVKHLRLVMHNNIITMLFC